MMSKTCDRNFNKKNKDFTRYFNKSKEKKVDILPKINSRNRIWNRSNTETHNEYYAMCETQNFFRSKTKEKKNKPVIPLLGANYIEKKANLINWKQIWSLIEKEKISKENQKFKERVISTKSAFLSFYDKKFVKAHYKMINEEYKKAEKEFMSKTISVTPVKNQFFKVKNINSDIKSKKNNGKFNSSVTHSGEITDFKQQSQEKKQIPKDNFIDRYIQSSIIDEIYTEDIKDNEKGDINNSKSVKDGSIYEYEKEENELF